MANSATFVTSSDGCAAILHVDVRFRENVRQRGRRRKEERKSEVGDDSSDKNLMGSDGKTAEGKRQSI